MKNWMKSFLSVTLSMLLIFSMSSIGFAKEKSSRGQNAKKVVVYFPNWGTYNAAHQSFSVGDIPWDKVTHVNHAFFTINKDMELVSLDSFADYQKAYAHSDGWDVSNRLAGHFGEYRYYKEKYPEVKIMISVGGWTRGENFHEMASSKSNRKIFIDSALDLMKEYPFIDGIDLDWEYPGIDRPKDENDRYDRGCPGGPEDGKNFTSLIREMREAFDSNDFKEKLLTIAAPGGYDKMRLQEPDKYEKYLDFINIMTYDMHGAWEQMTNNHSPIYANPDDPSGTSPTNIKEKYNTNAAMMEYVEYYKIPREKLTVGSPFYSRGWAGVEANSIEDALFAKATKHYRGAWDDTATPTPGGQEAYFKIKEFEKTQGWEKARDPYAKTPYIFNKSKGVFLTYEDEESLEARCKYINENDFGGIIIWEISGDSIEDGYPLMNVIQKFLIKPIEGKLPKEAKLLLEEEPKNGDFTLTIKVNDENTEEIELLENGKKIKKLDIKEVPFKLVLDFKDMKEGTYRYEVISKNKYGTTDSKVLKVIIEKQTEPTDPTDPTNPTNPKLDFDYKVTSSWNTGFNFDAIVKNTTDKTLKKVKLTFDYNLKISSVWSDFRLVSHDGNTYTFESASYLTQIKPGDVLKFGGSGAQKDNGEKPTNIKFEVIEAK